VSRRQRVRRLVLERREAIGYAAALAFAILLTLGVVFDWLASEVIGWPEDGLSGWPNERSANEDANQPQGYADGLGALVVWLLIFGGIMARLQRAGRRDAASPAVGKLDADHGRDTPDAPDQAGQRGCLTVRQLRTPGRPPHERTHG
jgi:hypothetical protein